LWRNTKGEFHFCTSKAIEDDIIFRVSLPWLILKFIFDIEKLSLKNVNNSNLTKKKEFIYKHLYIDLLKCLCKI